MITIKKSTLMIISIIIIIILSLSIGFNAKAASSSTTINSHGRLELNNSSGGGTIVLDSQDIQNNANNISTLNSNLTANSQPFRFSYQDGKYGYIVESEGADTFNPFSALGDVTKIYSNGIYTANTYNTLSTNITNAKDYSLIIVSSSMQSNTVEYTVNITNAATNCDEIATFSQFFQTSQVMAKVSIYKPTDNNVTLTMTSYRGENPAGNISGMIILGIK